jgi:hypothetical protein
VVSRRARRRAMTQGAAAARRASSDGAAARPRPAAPPSRSDAPTATPPRVPFPDGQMSTASSPEPTGIVAVEGSDIPARAPAARLAELVAVRRSASDAVDAEVLALRGRGVAWPAIAAALGVSRQGARQRYGAASTEARRAASDPSLAIHGSPPPITRSVATDEMTDSAQDEQGPTARLPIVDPHIYPGRHA